MSLTAEEKARETAEIEKAKAGFEKNKIVITFISKETLPENALGEKATSLSIVEDLGNGRLLVIPTYPSDNWY